MVALATVGDLAARYGTLTVEQAERAPALLDDASAQFRAAAGGQVISAVVDDTVTLRTRGRTLVLPQRPVTAVSSVTTVSDEEYVAGTWDWPGVDGLEFTNYPDAFVRVTYSHGYDPVPDDVVGAVCAMVWRVLGAPAAIAEGVVQQSETIGSYSTSQQFQQSAGASGSVRIFRSEVDVAGRFRRRARTLRTG